MHRVELKETDGHSSVQRQVSVPNAPCGVESSAGAITRNAGSGFLMHRVELKDKRRFAYKHWTIHLVPNAPCGVESHPLPRFSEAKLTARS